jgi:hypothetical protein
MKDYKRYIRITTWARARYTRKDKLIISYGGHDSIFKKIERAAFNKYIMNITR